MELDVVVLTRCAVNARAYFDQVWDKSLLGRFRYLISRIIISPGCLSKYINEVNYYFRSFPLISIEASRFNYRPWALS